MTDSTDCRILIVDDHPLIRHGIGLLIEQQPGWSVCGEADNAVDALSAAAATRPDIVIVDLTLKDSSGLDLIKDLQLRMPSVRALVLSMRDEGFYAERVLRAGARGYVTKEEGPGKVIEGIRRVLDDQIFLSEHMASKVMKRIVQGAAEEGRSAVDRLSDRELEIFELIGRGIPTREIAKRLCISAKTVETHREHIKEKLDVDSASSLLRYAIQWVQANEL